MPEGHNPSLSDANMLQPEHCSLGWPPCTVCTEDIELEKEVHWLSASLPRIPEMIVYSELIKILNKHSARWHNIHSDFPKHHLYHLCGSLPGNILWKLVLSGPADSTQVPSPSKLPAFRMKSKPSPMHLTLTAFYFTSVDIFWTFFFFFLKKKNPLCSLGSRPMSSVTDM